MKIHMLWGGVFGEFFLIEIHSSGVDGLIIEQYL